MKILFYSSYINGETETIYKYLDTIISKDQIENYRTINALTNRLYKPRDDLSIILLSIYDFEELLDLIINRNLFYDIPIILILPNRERNITSKAYKLRPRFIFYNDNNLIDLKAIMEKLIQKI